MDHRWRPPDQRRAHDHELLPRRTKLTAWQSKSIDAHYMENRWSCWRDRSNASRDSIDTCHSLQWIQLKLSKSEYESPNTTKAVILYVQDATKVSVAMIFEWRTSSVAKRWNDNVEEDTVLTELTLITSLPLLFAIESSDATKVARRQHQHEIRWAISKRDLELEAFPWSSCAGKKNNSDMRSAIQV